jgi:hypothetical protein
MVNFHENYVIATLKIFKKIQKLNEFFDIKCPC